MKPAALLLLVASACAGSDSPAAGVPELDVEPPGAAPAAPAARAAQPVEVADEPPRAPEDVYVHDPSGTWFPVAAGRFQRGQVTVYDPDGLDVGIAYAAQPNIDGTVFIYPSDRDPPDPIQSVKFAIEYHHPDARLLEERDVTVALGELDLRGEYVAYQVAGAISVGYVFQHDAWNLKYRFEFPASSDRDAALRDIAAVLEAPRWP